MCALAAYTFLGVDSSPVHAETIELEERAPNNGSYLWVPQWDASPVHPQGLDASLSALASEVAMRAPEDGRASTAVDSERLERGLSALIDDIDDRAQISVHLRDLRSDEVIFDHDGDRPLIPASNQKLLTSAAALDLLGPEYGFHTEVLLVGQELYIVGHGDPILDHRDMEKLALEVAAATAVAQVERIVVDDSAFSSRRFAPGFDPEGAGVSYQAPSGALSLNFNTVEVTVYGKGRGSRPAVSVFPPSTQVEVQNRARHGSGSLAIRSRGVAASRAREESRSRTVIEVAGRIPRGQAMTLRRRVDDPGLFAGGVFAHMLAQATGTEPLPVRVGTVGEADGEPELLAVHESPHLLEIVEGELAYSNNLMAEQLLRTVAWRMTGEPGDWENGRQVLEGYWRALGNDPDEFVFENGSGMSSRARLTTSGIVDVMAIAHRAGPERAGLIDVLPVAGEAGTMRGRLRGAGKRVRAKTGTMDGVSGLSGVIAGESGEPRVAFSILINVEQGNRMYAASRRDAEDGIVMAILDELDRREHVPAIGSPNELG
jgi:D-alanyl-D-alanine carboxypeptidase/D-alanyl-D-alanine-endopeptidase (penicillin-binding protein 4)